MRLFLPLFDHPLYPAVGSKVVKELCHIGQAANPLFSHCHSWFAASPARRGAGAGFDALDDIVVKPIA